jgi:hypothetical protein
VLLSNTHKCLFNIDLEKVKVGANCEQHSSVMRDLDIESFSLCNFLIFSLIT